MRTQHFTLALTVTLALAPCLQAQDRDAELADELAEAVAWAGDMPLRNYRQAVRDALDARVRAQAKDIVENQPGTVGASDGFGTRMGEAFANFLPILGFAVDAVNVSDDDKALIVDFNPLRTGAHGAFKLNATVSEPEPSAGLLAEIPDALRAAQEKAIRDAFGDFDDITWSLTYGYQRQATAGSEGLSRRPWLWGRHPSLYEPYIAELMDRVWSEATLGVDLFGDVWETVLVDAGFPIERIRASLTAGEVRTGIGKTRFEELRRRLIIETIVDFRLDERLRTLDLEKIGHLIDNQPQLVVTGAYRDRDELIGPDTFSATVKAELGINNFNRLLRRAALRGDLYAAYQEAIEDWDVLAKDRFTFSLTYLERDDQRVSFDYLLDDEDGGSSARSASLDIDGSRDLCGKVQYSRSIKRQDVEIEGETIFPRIDFSMEYVDVADDPARQDRWVAQLAYSYPIRDGLSIPLTLHYANHAEFLGDPDEQLGAHLGLSYGLDRLFGSGN